MTGVLNWELISAHVPGRDRKSCHKRWHYHIGADFNKGKWTTLEDERLMRGVELFGEQWAPVAGVVQTRNGDQCLQRWRNHLDPKINKMPWSVEEDIQLLNAVSTYGNKWSFIARTFFVNRDALSVRNREQALRNEQRQVENSKPKPPILFMDDCIGL